jgi:two-component system alkaline phosphatase synthesis response regulator PhoP
MNKKIYIVEDDANILYSLQAKLSLAGFKVEVNTGNVEIENLMDEIKKAKPDFIILDLILPRIDGFEVVRAIRSDNDISSLPIFIFTNLSDQDTKSRGVALGVNYYFIKNDFNVDDFVVKIKKIIENAEKLSAPRRDPA